MIREKTIELLRQHKLLLHRRFGVVKLGSVGSAARDVAHPASAVYTLVGFPEKATSAQHLGVRFYLKDLFGCTADLMTQKVLRKELRPFVDCEAV